MNTDRNIPFTKMEGTGNDFVVLDNRSLQLSEDEIKQLAPLICDRNFGVGSDGILALSAPQIDSVDYTMIFRNPDGSPAGMCGNGARCLALFADSLDDFEKPFKFNVHEQIYSASISDEQSVAISFPIETSIRKKTVDEQLLYEIYTGTEHIVIPVEDDKLANEDELKSMGHQLRYHNAFAPAGTNVNFINGKDSNHLKLQTYERGVEDLTLACGTGTIAAALVWHHLQQDKNPENSYSVETEGGALEVSFKFNKANQSYSNIKLKGPVHFVFSGTYLR